MTTIRKTLFCFLLLASMAPACCGTQFGLTDSQKAGQTNEWGAVVYNTQVSIVTKDAGKAFKTNQPIELLVRIRNLSTNEEYGIVVQTPVPSTEGLSFKVISPSGKDISPVFHRIIRITGLVMRVGPKAVDGFGFNLADICQVDEAGAYKIAVKMERWTPDKRRYEIVSNPLTVSVACLMKGHAY